MGCSRTRAVGVIPVLSGRSLRRSPSGHSERCGVKAGVMHDVRVDQELADAIAYSYERWGQPATKVCASCSRLTFSIT